MAKLVVNNNNNNRDRIQFENFDHFEYYLITRCYREFHLGQKNIKIRHYLPLSRPLLLSADKDLAKIVTHTQKKEQFFFFCQNLQKSGLTFGVFVMADVIFFWRAIGRGQKKSTQKLCFV